MKRRGSKFELQDTGEKVLFRVSYTVIISNFDFYSLNSNTTKRRKATKHFGS
jgi:hypothetical protein